MNSWDEMTDDELMAALADAVAESDAVPERRREAAHAAFTWRNIDEELAELLHDSALDAGAAVRSSATTVRALAFGRGAVTLEVEVDGDAVLGEVVDEDVTATTPATVSLQQPGVEDRTIEVDESGFFRFDGVAPGPARFVMVRAGWILATPWVVL
jgi:hypothetical protein